MNVTLDVSEEELVEISRLLERLREPVLTVEELEIVVASPIQAIRSVRGRLGCSLKTAKDIVDAARSKP